jgi:hypothetical protein
MLTVLLIKRRAQSHTDDRLAATQTVPSCECCDFEAKRPLEVGDAASDPPRATARSHIDGTTNRRYD